MEELLLNPMQRDLDLFKDYESSGKTEPVLFFYTWDKVAISIGRIQRNRQQLIDEAQKTGIETFIRPTGGKAVLHGGDICYCFIAKQNDPKFGGKLCQSFKAVNHYVRDLFFSSLRGKSSSVIAKPDSRSLREAAEQRRSNPETTSVSNSLDCFANARNDDSNSFNCFTTSVNSETLIESNGEIHKIIGAAQHMGRTAFIQQGSIQINKVDSELKYFSNIKTLSEINAKTYQIEDLCKELNNSTPFN